MTVTLLSLAPAALDAAADQAMVPMRDRVRLATDVYLPHGAGPFPAVLVRLPYDKCGRYTFMPQLAPHFTDRGYAFVVQDVRGKFRSEGETVPFVHEVEDGYDTLEWLTAEKWSDGRVGMFGDSYYGFTQWAAVASAHPALRAIVPRVTSADLEVLHGWWGEEVLPLYGADYFAHFWVDRLIHDYEVDWSHRPMAEVFDEGFAAIGERSKAFDLTLRYAQGRSMVKYPGPHPFEVLGVPVLHSVGWFDNILPYSMDDYTTLRAVPEKAHLQYLVADSTDHENYQLRFVPVTFEHDHDVNDQALAELIPIYLGPSLEFFDVFLKERADAGRLARVAWHLGHDGWHRSDVWPPSQTQELRLYLAAASRSLAGPEGGVLARTAESAAETVRWLHDPENLVPSTAGNPFAFLHEFPDEREVECRDDVLTFTSEPMSADVDLAGPVSAFLAVGSTAPSMHVFVKLCDVEPGGSARMLLRGQVLVREPDSAALVEVKLSHTGYRVRRGHQLRLHIACSDFPLYLWYPGTDENPWFATETKPNEQTLISGGAPRSYLSLTVMPEVQR